MSGRSPSSDLRFGRGTRAPEGPRVRVMAGVLAVVTLGLWLVRGMEPSPSEPIVSEVEVVVEVRGEVAQPGYHPIPGNSTVGGVVARFGGKLSAPDNRPVPAGAKLFVEGGSAQLGIMDNPLVVGIPVDLNQAGEAALRALPGVGPSRARAIVDERTAHGPFRSVQELERVHGIGPATVEALQPFVEVRP